MQKYTTDIKYTVANLKPIPIYLSKSLHILFLQLPDQCEKHRRYL